MPKKYYKKKKGKGKAVTRSDAYKIAKRVTAHSLEKKVHDVGSISQYIHNSGTVFHLSAIPQGDTANQRDGDVVTARSIAIRYSFEVSASTAARVSLWIDRDSNAAVPAVSTILDSPISVYSYCSNPNKLRFKCIYNKLLNFHNYDLSGGSSAMLFKELYINLSRKMTFNADTTSPRANALYMLVITDQASDVAYFNANCRLRYYDG